MKKEEIEKKVTAVFLESFDYLDKKTFTLEKDRNEFEDWDSLSHMQLVSSIEEQFDVSFDMDEVVDIQKPADFVSLIAKKV